MMVGENPYYYNRPTRPEDFISRWPIVDNVVENLTKPYADSCAVIGGKRFGKSSLLEAIKFRLLVRCQQHQMGQRYVWPCLIDLKGSRTESEETVYAGMLRLLYEELRYQENVPFPLAETELHALIATKPKAVDFYDFRETLLNLCRTAEKSLGAYRLVLLLDEGEFIVAYPWAQDLFGNLRSMVYSGMLSDMVQLVLTGSTRIVQIREEGSPLLNALNIYWLEGFPDEDIQHLIERSGRFEVEIEAAIKVLCGGHPFMAQYLLHHLWQEGLDAVNFDKVQKTAVQLRQTRALDFDGWWQAVGDSGRQAYALMVQAESWPDCEWLHESSMLEQLVGSDQPLDQGLTALYYHGLVRRDTSQKRYRAVCSLFRDWLVHNAYLAHGDKQQDTHSLAIRLYWIMTNYYNLDELETLAFELDVKFEDLGGVGLAGKAREFIHYFQRQHGVLDKLAEHIRQEKDFIEF